mmetsp:Transcript_29107/g.82036  ORF Transcript_29107/g.82036 Transcript_29107/m.82036 type:complete len:362 (-) Transcript_29107:226-1311(-)
MLLVAVAITVTASAGNNIGKALQKRATVTLPRFELEGKVLKQYLRNRTYLLGMAVDIAGALLMIVAFSQAPVSVVQPVASGGLAALALFSHFYLQERLHFRQWVAVLLAALGTVGLGMSAEDVDDSSVDATRALLTILVCLLCIGLLSMQSLRRPKGSWGDDTVAAVIVGLEAGGAFGLSAACCRTGFMLGSHHILAIPAGLGASVGLTSTGFALQTRGLKDGNTVVVCTCAAVAAMVTGVVIGLVGLGEPIPEDRESQLLQGASWISILVGVMLLSGAGGMTNLLVEPSEDTEEDGYDALADDDDQAYVSASAGSAATLSLVGGISACASLRSSSSGEASDYASAASSVPDSNAPSTNPV